MTSGPPPESPDAYERNLATARAEWSRVPLSGCPICSHDEDHDDVTGRCPHPTCQCGVTPDSPDLLAALVSAAERYIAFRDEMLADWKALAECGHGADNDCPEFRHIQETHHIDDDAKYDDPIREALAAIRGAVSPVPPEPEGETP